MAKATGKSLYDRLGGKGAIVAVVDTFVGKVGADQRINGYFASTDLDEAQDASGQSNLRSERRSLHIYRPYHEADASRHGRQLMPRSVPWWTIWWRRSITIR